MRQRDANSAKYLGEMLDAGKGTRLLLAEFLSYDGLDYRLQKFFR